MDGLRRRNCPDPESSGPPDAPISRDWQMRPLIQRLVDQGPGEQATVLVVGAGDGADLPLLRRLGASRLILAEAHPGQAEVLARRTDPAQGPEVWLLAITAKPMVPAALRLLHNPAFLRLQDTNS